MADIKVFQHSKFGLVRAVEKEGEPLFLAADICTSLGLGNVTESLRNLDPDEKTMVSLKVGTREQMCNFVTESGMYCLIMRSNKPEAKQFRKWVTADVLPRIRKTGSYSTEDMMAKTIANPEWAIEVLSALKQEKEKRIKAEERAEESCKARIKAIKERTYISSKREATMIGKLAAKSRECMILQEENNGLKIKLGMKKTKSSTFIRIKDIKWVKELFVDDPGVGKALSAKLKRLTLAKGLASERSTAGIAYPSEVVSELHDQIVAGKVSGLKKYLK